MATARRTHALAVAALLAGVVLRFLQLDADPHDPAWIGYITDEGRWTTHARDLALFGRLLNLDWPLHLFLAPLFQLAEFAVFRLFGVGVLTSRLVSAVSGSLVLVVFWAGLRRIVSPAALLVGLTLLALETDLLSLSRLAVPEMAVMSLALIVYFLVVSERRSPGRLVLAGLLMAAAVGMKLTALPGVAIFTALILLQPPAASAVRSRGREMLLFGAGFLAPPLLALASVLAWGRAPDLLLSGTAMVTSFLAPATPYQALSFFVEDPSAPAFNVGALGAWVATLGWMASERTEPDDPAHRHAAAATAWVVMYAALMLGLAYFPARYKAHIFVPMSVSIAVGLTCLERAGLAGVDATLARATTRFATALDALVALPTAVLVAPLLATAASLVGVDAARLRLRLACVLVSLALTTWVVHRRRLRRASSAFLVVFPVVATFGWVLVGQAAGHVAFWPSARLDAAAAAWAPILVAAGALAVAATTAGPRTAPSGARWLTASALAYSAVALLRIAPGYVDPHYSIRDTSRDLGTLLAGFPGVVATSGADALFAENRLRYATVRRRTWPAWEPEVLVIAFDFDDQGGRLARDYCLLRRYELYVSPEYYRARPRVTPTTSLGERVSVYRRAPRADAGAECPRADVAKPPAADVDGVTSSRAGRPRGRTARGRRPASDRPSCRSAAR